MALSSEWIIKYNDILHNWKNTRTQRSWIKYQRINFKNLNNVRKDLLDKLTPIIGFDWKYKPVDKEWLNSFENIYRNWNETLEQKDWITYQRLNRESLSESHKEHLNKLIPIIKYDWNMKQKEIK